MSQEAFFSLPNLFWFAAGIGVEVVFLGLGVSPMGMAWGANVGQAIGIIEPFKAVASAGEAAAAVAPVTGSATGAAVGVTTQGVASNGVSVLNF